MPENDGKNTAENPVAEHEEVTGSKDEREAKANENEQFDMDTFRKFFNREMAARRKEAEQVLQAVQALQEVLAKSGEENEGEDDAQPDIDALIGEKVGELEKQFAEKLTQTAAEYEKRLSLERQARQMGFVDEVEAAKLALTLYADEITAEAEEDGLKVAGVEDALKKLAEKYPQFLAKPAKPNYLDKEGGNENEPDVRAMFGI